MTVYECHSSIYTTPVHHLHPELQQQRRSHVQDVLPPAQCSGSSLPLLEPILCPDRPRHEQLVSLHGNLRAWLADYRVGMAKIIHCKIHTRTQYGLLRCCATNIRTKAEGIWGLGFCLKRVCLHTLWGPNSQHGSGSKQKKGDKAPTAIMVDGIVRRAHEYQ